jgi:enoyl-CoA hydratase/carnithine racemase
LIGRSRALELFVTAKTLNAPDALRIGLIDQVADPVLEAALQLALLPS